ncbi:hypothetical protein FEM33_15390 [Dyadobacter flavalbus]|uniref:Uncharacterized protein n=1 Tax=Dyadobacter flavalbus TaxID=2579942 RepID=A0A5M8QVL5_9BACT|nr:hypothetical protein [Dyadobacter flavalbus]KAA6438854.1 hypothetical protein FEM33_15390 [Dyadobacter flavalbus]
MVNVEYLITNSGDSIIDKYSYSDGILKITLNVTEVDKKLMLLIKSENFSFDNFYLDNKEDVYRTCRIQIQELSKVLSVENGIYMPASSFGGIMQESKSNYNLAYGRKKSKVNYIFSLTGYDTLISCLIFDINSIRIEELS